MTAVEGPPSFTDVVLVTSQYVYANPETSRPLNYFPDAPLQIDEDLFIGPFGDMTDTIMDACEPSGYNFDPYRQYGSPYGVWRENAPAGANELAFDPDLKLRTCVTLSRIVYPTSIGYSLAARIRRWKNGVFNVIPYITTDMNPRAYVLDQHQNWLIPGDVDDLRALVHNFNPAEYSQRIKSAIWYLEAAFRTYYADLRWPLITTGLEALLRIRDERLPDGRYVGSTKVFVDRMLELGKLDQALEIKETDLVEMYRKRSIPVHGQLLGELNPETRRLYRQKETVLREVIRRVILEKSVASIFSSDATITSSLPLRK